MYYGYYTASYLTPMYEWSNWYTVFNDQTVVEIEIVFSE